MRAGVLSKLGLGEGDLSETELDQELNRVWRFGIPNRVDAAAVRGLVSLQTVAGDDSYDLDVEFPSAPLLAVEGPAYYGSSQLDLYTDPVLFWEDFDPASTEQAAPQGLLVQGRTLTVRPIPAAIYTVKIQAARYRDALTSSGVADELEASVVVEGAAARLAHQLGQEDVGARYDQLFERDLSELSPRYRANTASMPRTVMAF